MSIANDSATLAIYDILTEYVIVSGIKGIAKVPYHLAHLRDALFPRKCRFWSWHIAGDDTLQCAAIAVLAYWRVD